MILSLFFKKLVCTLTVKGKQFNNMNDCMYISVQRKIARKLDTYVLTNTIKLGGGIMEILSSCVFIFSSVDFIFFSCGAED